VVEQLQSMQLNEMAGSRREVAARPRTSLLYTLE
jgi:hypothetical protein